MNLKEKFEFSTESGCWIYFPFFVSKTQYENCDWTTIETIFCGFLENQEFFIEEGKRALFNYAKEINFFSPEELDDLSFDNPECRLLFRDQTLSGFKLIYSVQEDGTQKIPWKDLYGIWTVDFIDRTITHVDRVAMLDVD
jgi:hypothetical protein